MQRRPKLTSAVRSTAVLLGLTPFAAAQNPSEITFSVDWQGPLMGVTTPTGAPINEADLLVQPNTFFGPDAPLILRQGTFLQQYSSCVGHAPGVSCGVEIDAISFGRDARLRDLATYDFVLLFSVDEHSVGAPVPTPPPNVASEAASGDASGDVYLRRYVGGGPFGPTAGFNVGVADGDGRSVQGSSLFPGLGIGEPSPATPTVPELGDKLDALDLRPMGSSTAPLFFSLEQGLNDPREPNVAVTNSAALQPNPVGGAYTGADILVAGANNQVQGYADPITLGLSPMGLDDIDAIVVAENGVAGFQPSFQPYDWLPGGTTAPRDMLFFSVRRGSAIIGQIDSLLGIPITESDVLVPPIGGGMLGTTPGIFATAESLGLEVTRGAFLDSGDDLNALDMADISEEPFKDCQPNGTWDALDISGGFSMDSNTNGVPDECEDPGDAFCDCDTAAEAPCGNSAATSDVGCLNNTGLGGKQGEYVIGNRQGCILILRKVAFGWIGGLTW